MSVELKAEQEVGHHPSDHDLVLSQAGHHAILRLSEVAGELKSSQVADSADEEPPETSVRHLLLVSHQVPYSMIGGEV